MTHTKTPTMREKRQAIHQWILGRSCRLCLLVVLGVFSVLYIIETNAVSTKGFAISDLERKIETLEQEQQRLNVEIAKSRSMKSVEERLQKMNMVAAADVQYVSVVGTAVARR